MQLEKSERSQFKIFTPGPTQISEEILRIGSKQPPYNRTEHFSEITFEIIEDLKYIFQTKGDVVILTASGTGAMEASILNFLNKNDHVLIINGGKFGELWVDLCKLYEISHDELSLKSGVNLNLEKFADCLENGKFTAVLVNAHETSTGVLYDIKNIGKLTNKRNIMLLVDGISSICADQFLMDEWHIDVAILSSQKALSLPPGLSFIAFNKKAKLKMELIPVKSLYFNLSFYLKNQIRGQMPFTPAISIFIMLNERLKQIRKIGLNNLILNHRKLAELFRSLIDDLPISILSENSSNALTAVLCNDKIDASIIVKILESNYQMYIAPSGGSLKKRLFRVSHMGHQTEQEIKILAKHLKEIISIELFKGLH